MPGQDARASLLSNDFRRSAMVIKRAPSPRAKKDTPENGLPPIPELTRGIHSEHESI